MSDRFGCDKLLSSKQGRTEGGCAKPKRSHMNNSEMADMRVGQLQVHIQCDDKCYALIVDKRPHKHVGHDVTIYSGRLQNAIKNAQQCVKLVRPNTSATV